VIESDKLLTEIYANYVKICKAGGEKPQFTLKDLKRLRDQKAKRAKEKRRDPRYGGPWYD